MKFSTPLSVSEIAEIINAKVIGNSTIPITGINEIHKVEVGDISFVDHPKYYDKCLQSDATYIIINKEMDAPENKVLFYVSNPFEAYNNIVKSYFPFEKNDSYIHPSAIIGTDNVIQPGVFIGPNVVIGSHNIIHANTSIQGNVNIGDHCIIHSNTVLGSDAFYYHTDLSDDMIYTKMESCGRVIIHNWVEIGASCTIDRGVSGDTIIGDGSKLDNQVHVGHGVVIGRNCLIAAQVGIAGKTVIGNNVKLWGQVGVNKTLTIGDGAEVYAQSGVPGDLEGGKKYFGSPTMEAKDKMKENVWIKRIPEIWEKLEKLAKNSDI